MANDKVYGVITKVLIERIEERIAQGDMAAPWQKTWDAKVGMPRNLISDKAYRGANLFLMMCMPYASPYYVTRSQIKKLGGNIRKGESYTPVVFWKFPTEEEKAKGKEYVLCRFYQVWNTDQCEGLEHKRLTEMAEGKLDEAKNDPLAEAEALVEGYFDRPAYNHGGDRAFYVPSMDVIQMPNLDDFESAEKYYLTLFHELAHSTGHRSRLERDGVCNPAMFASHEYSKEELVAEMTAAMLAGYAGIDMEAHVENTAAYLQHWLKALKSDTNLLVQAGGQAQKAADYIRRVKWEKKEGSDEAAA